MKKKKKNELIPKSDSPKSITRRGIFEEGVDGRGNPYEKKLDTNGDYSKSETLKDGTQKITLKHKP